MPPEQLERLLQQAGPVSLLVLVSPTYQGLASDLPELVAIAHRHGAAVLVDEAHGGHFGFDSSLPVSPWPLALIWWCIRCTRAWAAGAERCIAFPRFSL